MVATKKAKKNVTPKNRIAGVATGSNGEAATHMVTIPALQQKTSKLILVGDRPLLVNNKLSVAQAIADRYGPDGDPTQKHKPSGAQQYLNSFYTLPDSKHNAPHPKAVTAYRRAGSKNVLALRSARRAVRTTRRSGSLPSRSG